MVFRLLPGDVILPDHIIAVRCIACDDSNSCLRGERTATVNAEVACTIMVDDGWRVAMGLMSRQHSGDASGSKVLHHFILHDARVSIFEVVRIHDGGDALVTSCKGCVE